VRQTLTKKGTEPVQGLVLGGGGGGVVVGGGGEGGQGGGRGGVEKRGRAYAPSAVQDSGGIGNC